ncbi:helix-turn-helix domain-containing protein [Deinococcus sp. HMF7620]|uniref:Helix-turn-helix domain-containing protein n=2 Tax=Deinococcus arboris TaxID=2682977 RepID=A0A7C9I604_9DEIO|nr:helix-turn-helix domain-containing protein [Deinococcus arboris]
MSRSRTLCAGRVKRARIILMSNQGYTHQEIAEKIGVSYHTSCRWIGRFNALGLPGLDELGRPHVYSEANIGDVIQTALTNPDDLGLPFGSWTLDRLVTYLTDVKGIPIRRSRISEIFRHEGLRWRQQEGWMGVRVDPDFGQKRGLLKASTPVHLSTVS